MNAMEWVLGVVASVVVAFITAQLTARHEQRKLREQLKLDYSIESALRHLLENPDYATRSFEKIKRHMRGFKDDDELRMALIRAGAVVCSKREDEEYWGLLDRNLDKVK